MEIQENGYPLYTHYKVMIAVAFSMELTARAMWETTKALNQSTEKMNTITTLSKNITFNLPEIPWWEKLLRALVQWWSTTPQAVLPETIPTPEPELQPSNDELFQDSVQQARNLQIKLIMEAVRDLGYGPAVNVVKEAQETVLPIRH